ncbi:MAG TPA: hypothetical protein VN851_21570 [Thermoanaerobaculia bacterium]|nr:hypothetical protein [Thermoanaerobaculia bacterium]
MSTTLTDAIASWIDTLPADARVVVEGGHFTIRKRSVPAREPILRSAPDRLFLVELDPNASDVPALPGEIARGPRVSDSSDLSAILDLGAGAELDVRAHPAILHAFQLDFAPSATELASFVQALDAGRQVRGRVAAVGAALFLGDRVLPPFVRAVLAAERFLPAAYQEEIERSGFSEAFQIYSESVCRNRGKERLDRYREGIVDPAKREATYRQRGFTLFEDPLDSGIYFLAADVLLDRPRSSAVAPLIGLTKQAKTPTCGLILAGKLGRMSRDRWTHVLSVYDEADDPRIAEKNADGMVIFSCLGNDTGLAADFLTLRPGRVQHDRFRAGEIAKPGLLASGEELERRARHRPEDLTEIERRCEESCFPAPRSGTQRSEP